MKKEKQQSIVEKIKENYGYFFAIISAIYAVGIIILKAYEYLRVKVFFNYYDIDYNLYKSNNLDIFNILIHYMAILSLTFYSIYLVYEIFKQKELKNRNILKRAINIFITNFLLVYFLNPTNVSGIDFIIVSAIEIISVYFVLIKSNKKEEEINLKELLKSMFVKAPIVLIFIIICIQFYELINIVHTKDYRMIDDNHVIVYTAEDFFITLECDVNNNELTIYKGTQTKIDNNQVLTQKKTYEKVVVI